MLMVGPLDFILRFLADDPQHVEEVEFGVYRYHPHSVIDDRINHRLKLEQLTPRYKALLGDLRSDEEIAFNSRVWTSGNGSRHVPLVDFASREQPLVEEASVQLIGEYGPRWAALFASGRSYHLYLGALLTRSAWVKFMGHLLLLNQPDGPILTDCRWIGHRLMAGYGSLRWSANTEPYATLGPPVLIREW